MTAALDDGGRSLGTRPTAISSPRTIGVAASAAARYLPAAPHGRGAALCLIPSLKENAAMDRPASRLPNCVTPRYATRVSLALVALTLLPTTGCIHLLLATGIYMFQGGNIKDAEYEGFKKKTIVVFCSQPASQEFRHAGASRQIAQRVSELLEQNFTKKDKVTIVQQRKVDAWIDENDSDDYLELGKAVKADMILYIDLAHFDLMPGQTVYQGSADVTLKVHDISSGGNIVWSKPLGEILYPLNAPIAAQSKSPATFQAEYVNVLAEAIGKHFYAHDPTANWAMDALADR
jgi:predicted nucleic acid-binding protein